jgi:hypothetical protein
VPAGATLSARGFNSSGASTIYGYLVPASWVPPSPAIAGPATASSAR